LPGRGLCEGPITRPGESYRLWCRNSPLTPTMTGENKKSAFRTVLPMLFNICTTISVAVRGFPRCVCGTDVSISLASHDAVRLRRLETVTDSHKQLSTAVTSIGSRAGTRVRVAVLITAALFWRKRRKSEHERQGFAAERQFHSTIFLVLNLRERDNLKDLGVAQSIILKCIFNK
jgi:hypothetical protein